jgi:hypothetical protein
MRRDMPAQITSLSGIVEANADARREFLPVVQGVGREMLFAVKHHGLQVATGAK